MAVFLMWVVISLGIKLCTTNGRVTSFFFGLIGASMLYSGAGMRTG